MNTSNGIDYSFLLEVDNNPIIVFNYEGKILYLNSSAEILMSYVKPKEIFKLAVNNAPSVYGTKTTQIELSYNQLKFYAVNVSYNSDDWIAIRLYYRPRDKRINKKSSHKGEILTDINLLLDVAITQFKIGSSTDIRLVTDQDIPKTLLNQNSFSKLLRKCLNSFKVASFVDIELKLGIGEHIIIDEQRYPLIILKFISNGRHCNEDSEIKLLSEEMFLVSNLNENSIEIEIPLINK